MEVKNTIELFENLKKEKLESLKGLISDIEIMIKEREGLNKEILKGLDKVKIETSNTILSLNEQQSLTTEGNSDKLKLIGELRKKIIELEEIKLNEKLNCFRDIADLKKELRLFIREFKEKETKQDILDGLL